MVLAKPKIRDVAGEGREDREHTDMEAEEEGAEQKGWNTKYQEVKSPWSSSRAELGKCQDSCTISGTNFILFFSLKNIIEVKETTKNTSIIQAEQFAGF